MLREARGLDVESVTHVINYELPLARPLTGLLPIVSSSSSPLGPG